MQVMCGREEGFPTKRVDGLAISALGLPTQQSPLILAAQLMEGGWSMDGLRVYGGLK